jgi:hypothetical protein
VRIVNAFEGLVNPFGIVCAGFVVFMGGSDFEVQFAKWAGLIVLTVGVFAAGWSLLEAFRADRRGGTKFIESSPRRDDETPDN